MSLIRSRVIQKPYQLFRLYFLSEKDPRSTLSNLSFDTNYATSIEKFKSHNWTKLEIAHYSFLSSVILFVYIIFPASFLIKTSILLPFILCFLIPVTSQFFVHALPIFSWLALFFSCGKIPDAWKPAISVKVLPALETILYGDNLSNVLATTNNTMLDILAWLPYGMAHFSAPFVVAIFIFLFAPPTSLRSFGFAFGYMNLLGVMTQLLFPAASPWYKNLYGLQPANYTMSGSPGGLGRIDELLGFDMYTTTFSNSPVIFGAFPSLHSGCSVMDVLFLCWLFPRLRIVWWGYATLLWWSTMYLTHHYFVDLIGGAALSLAVFQYTKYNHLPIVEEGKFCRWSYTQVSKIDIQAIDPLANNYINIANDIEQAMPLGRFDTPFRFQNASNSLVAPSTEAFEMAPISRSRQASRSFITAQVSSLTSNLAPNQAAINAAGKSTSSLNLPLTQEEERPEEFEDNSSLNNSGTPSVFDEETNHISSTTSITSLDELDPAYAKKYKSK